MLSIEAHTNQQPQNNEHSKKMDDPKVHTYNIPTSNSFDLLNKKVNEKDINNKLHGVQKIKIPPITVVGATNFTNSIQLLNKLTPNTDFTIKYMSIGTKILLKSIEEYNDFKKALNDANIEFFSHDVQSEKIDRFILSGIAKVSFQEIVDSLKTYQVEPLEIREINLKTKKFDEEGSYIVSFRQGTTKIQNLNKMIINYTVPKWRMYLKATNNITQCRRCQIFGHGIRNCNMKFKCSKCGLDHPSDNCNSPISKCANCKGEHNSTSTFCPKRKEFLEMRTRLAATNNKKSAKPTPAPRNNLKNFPEMPKSSKNSNAAAVTAPTHPAKVTNWSSLLNTNPSTKSSSTANAATDKFQLSDIGPIMCEILTGLSRCQNKEQQLVLMFEMAAKHVYNVGP